MKVKNEIHQYCLGISCCFHPQTTLNNRQYTMRCNSYFLMKPSCALCIVSYPVQIRDQFNKKYRLSNDSKYDDESVIIR